MLHILRAGLIQLFTPVFEISASPSTWYAHAPEKLDKEDGRVVEALAHVSHDVHYVQLRLFHVPPCRT